MRPCSTASDAFTPAEMAFKSFDLLRQAGFDNLNLDLMFAIPGQTLEVWRETLGEAAALGSEHLSSYEVIYEEDTPLYEQLQAGKVDADEDLACAMYEELVERATQRRLPTIRSRQLRPRRHCQPSTINLSTSPAAPAATTSITGGAAPFTGSAPAQPATSAACGPRTGPTRSSTASNLSRADAPVESREELAPLARAGETAAFGLRMVAGLAI